MSVISPKTDLQLSYRLPYIVLGGAVVLGWAYLATMVIDMISRMDMGEMGPGMELFNQFNMFQGLPEHVRVQLASLCLPLAQEAFGMPALVNMGFFDYFLLFVMWFMMVLAMMLPTAMPMLRTFHEARAGKAIYVVAGGYLAVWAAFSVVATVAQGVLHELGVMSPMMLPVFSTLTITTVIAAAIYQFTPAKQACLDRCRTPNVALALQSGEQRQSAFRFGIEQGLYCLGCCWALMVLMFAVGIMNIIWIALLGLIMTLEKKSKTPFTSYGIGVALLLWGGANVYFARAGLSLSEALGDRLF